MRAQGRRQVAAASLGIGQDVATDVGQLHRLAQIIRRTVPVRIDIEQRADHHPHRSGNAVTIAVKRSVIRDAGFAGVLCNRLDQLAEPLQAGWTVGKQRARLGRDGVIARPVSKIMRKLHQAR